MIEKIFLNGHLITQDKKNPAATAFAVSKGKIIKAGSDAEILSMATTATGLEMLNDKVVIPGFIDAHIHIWKVGNLLTYQLDLRGVKSIAEMQQLLLDFALAHPERKWILARGFNEALFHDKKMPDRFDLDLVIKDKPVAVMRTCAHQLIVNSKALQVAAIKPDVVPPAGGQILKFPNGDLKGHFTETAIGLVMKKIPDYSPEEYRKMILKAQDVLISEGITSATDPAVMPDLLNVYKSMDKNGELRMRINAIAIRLPDGAKSSLPLPEKYESPHLKIDTVKFFADGGLSGMTAALYEPYLNTSGNKGLLRLEKSSLKKMAAEAQMKGFRIATHAIGDAAMDLVCEVYEDLWDEFRISGNRIEHVGLPSKKNLEQMKRMKIHAVMQPVFIKELGRNFIQSLDLKRLNILYPIKSVLQKGINVALSSDAPVVRDFSPLTGIQSAMERKTQEGLLIGEEEKISFGEALYGYTMGSALANGDEHTSGSLEKGKFADFTVLSENPIERDAAEIAGIKVVNVCIGGVKCN